MAAIPSTTNPYAGGATPIPGASVYWPLVTNDLPITTIDQAIPAGKSIPFDVVGSVMYCYDCDKADVTYKIDDGLHEQPLRPGTGINYLTLSQIVRHLVSFKRITITNNSDSDAHVCLYYGYGLPSEYKDTLQPGQTALPVTDAAVEANTTDILNTLTDCCAKVQLALGSILTALQNMASSNTTVPYPSYAALAAAVTLGMAPATLAQVVVAADTPPTHEFWQLRAPADGATFAPGDISQAAAGIVVPDDYDAAANDRVWYRT